MAPCKLSSRRSTRPRSLTWTNDPKLASSRPAYTLLLGIVGGPDDAVRIEQHIDVALSSRDATNLSAMLAADLELRGSTRVDWLEQTYFADRKRTLPEIEAALACAKCPWWRRRNRVAQQESSKPIASFIKMRSPMAGFVAMELADWKAWDATADYVGIIRSKAVTDPAGEFAILSYLKQSPATVEQAAMQSSTDQSE